MASEEKHLREALIRSLREGPLLLSTSEDLLTNEWAVSHQEIRGSLVQLLDRETTLVEADEISFQGVESAVAQRFRTMLQVALSGDTRLTDKDAELLDAMGFEKLGEFRSTLYAGLGGPAEIPKQDLAIYVSSDDDHVKAFRESLEEQLDVLPDELSEARMDIRRKMMQAPETTPSQDLPAEEALPKWESPHKTPTPSRVLSEGQPGVMPELPEPVEDVSLEIRTGRAGTTVVRSIDVHDFNPVPRLTAALEAAGFDEQDFGFILRYGRYAPEGRVSDFIVGGLGLAELSRRIVAWLEGQAPMDAQVQVVDEGSGELNVYLLTPEDT